MPLLQSPEYQVPRLPAQNLGRSFCCHHLLCAFPLSQGWELLPEVIPLQLPLNLLFAFSAFQHPHNQFPLLHPPGLKYLVLFLFS